MSVTNAELIQKAEKVIDAFPGFLFSRESNNTTCFKDHGEHVDCTFAFQKNMEGKIALLLVQYALERHLKRAAEDLRKDQTRRWVVRLNSAEFDRLGRALRYASPLILSDAPPEATKCGPSLAELLSHAVVAFENDYADIGSNGALPSIQVWSNLLRVLSDEPLDWLEYEKHAIVAKRSKVVILRHAESFGLIKVEKVLVAGKRKTLLSLTETGSKLKARAITRLAEVEEDWRKRIGVRDYEVLRNAFVSIVQDQDLEYPFFNTGYGPGDESVTGGNYRPAIKGPPRIPMRGAEFPVVIRDKSKSVHELPLSALLSQCLMAFAVEYEADGLGALIHVSRVLTQIPDEGKPLKDVKPLGNVEGSGKSLHERHLDVVVEPGKPRDGERLVYLTPKGKHIRDAYPYTAQKIEKRWRERYGPAIGNIRRMLIDFEQQHGVHEPAYPSPSMWMFPWFKPFVIRGN